MCGVSLYVFCFPHIGRHLESHLQLLRGQQGTKGSGRVRLSPAYYIFQSYTKRNKMNTMDVTAVIYTELLKM